VVLVVPLIGFRLVPRARTRRLGVAGNPLEDLGHLDRPEGIILRGRWLPRAEPERMMTGAHDGCTRRVLVGYNHAAYSGLGPLPLFAISRTS
jgi:hypothetical protein